MAKKSQRRAVRYEKDKAGCMWGFISMLDFRHGHSTRKLIADKRRSSKHSEGVVHSKNKFEALSDMDEVCHGTFDGGESKRPTVRTIVNKPSVKKLIEEEMFTDQNAMKDIDNSERREVFLKLDSKRKKKSSERKRNIADDLNLDAASKSETLHHQHSRKQFKDNLDVDTIIEEFCNLRGVCSMMRSDDGEVEKHGQPNQKQKHVVSEKHSRDAIREFVNQMILNGKDLEEARKFLFSDEIMEALQLISSDKELFLAFLQNPNPLVLKCVQEFENSHRVKDNDSNFSEQDHGNKEQTSEIVNHKKHNFFRKKVKSQSKNSTNENVNTNISNRIVILKPGSIGSENSKTGKNIASSLDSHDTVEYNSPSVRGSSHFSLTEIKKKLKHAIGRERHGKAIGKDNVGMRSPNKDHFFIEKIARPSAGVTKGDKTGTNKDLEAIVEREKGIYPKQGVSNLYIEAKKHLSEMVGNEDENIMDLSSRQNSKTLGRIISFPDYNFSPLSSPRRDWEDHFVTAKTRLRDENYTNKSQEIKSDSNLSDGLIHVDKEENCCPVRDEIVTEGDAESAKEIAIVESSSQSVGLSAESADQSHDISESSDCAEFSQCLEQDVTEQNQSPSPSHSSLTGNTKEQEITTDASGRPSPVSVLDALFLEDDACSGNSRCQPGKHSCTQALFG
ncbi:phosphatidylinositol N-acetyglucosaminlytransferase subunit P-like protein [Medicago truncatula]|uniref:Phosphatidylinositol N-acetyglucosaminlytransferase subunit P-like protein n=1 Tax=Medicago truncatula TaxID=3880 RepID=A0A072TPX4_MEDTR|nr:phosphatidylinositol N-acetyglucosaminlytransferase subunit P-like protein [Medicago truncatula]